MVVYLTKRLNAACSFYYNQNYTIKLYLWHFLILLKGVISMLENKWEVRVFLKTFEVFANWDGEKHFLTMETENPKGILTIMKSSDGLFYYHRKNELYWDIREIKVETDILTDIIWAFRQAINKSITEMPV